MSEQQVFLPEVAPAPELLEEVVPVKIEVTKAEPLTKEERLKFLADLQNFSDWWKLPLPQWCYDMSPMNNPIAVQFFLRDAEHYTRIKNGDETMPEEEFKKFEEKYLARLEEYRELRRQKSKLTQPQKFSLLPCFDEENEKE